VPTIRDQVRSNFPETYRVLTEKYDGKDGSEDVVGNKISVTMSLFFPEGKDEKELNEFQRGYLADYATRLIIRPAIDFYGVRTGMSDDIEPRTASHSLSQRGPGTGRRNYDRIRMLADLDASLAASLAANEDAFMGSIVPAGSTVAGIMISSTPGQLKSLDPQLMPSPASKHGVPRIPPWSWSEWVLQDVTEWPP
jgi:hypothetical protein